MTDLVVSPSFVIINKYTGRDGLPFYHIDMYRIEDEKEIAGLGLEELFEEEAVFVVEWAQRIEKILPKNCKKVRLDYVGENERDIRMVN